MRIGIVTGEYPPMRGGIGAYTRILAGELSRQGQVVNVLSKVETANTDPTVQLSNTIHSWDLTSLFKIKNWAQANHLDIINVQYQTAAFGMSPWIHFIPDVIRIPVVVTFHDLRYPYLFPKAGRLREWIVNRLANAAAGNIITNHEDYQKISSKRHKQLIPIGSNITQRLPDDYSVNTWRTAADARPDDLLIAYFGLINRSKGLETLLESLAALCAQGIPIHLVMVGGGAGISDPTNTEYLKAFKHRIMQLNLERIVHWTGYLEDEASVGAYLSASDVVVLPFIDGASYRRGSLMAAIYYGCAIVTTKPQVEISTFSDGNNMLLVEADSIKLLQNALLDVYQSSELRHKLRNGAKKLAKQFEWEQIAYDTVKFFERVLGT